MSDNASVTQNPRGDWTISNGLIRATVDPDQGADITSLVLIDTGEELLWTPPDALGFATSSDDDSASAFYDAYRGGVQDLFPNAGDTTTVHGAVLPFHGEARRRRWLADPTGGLTLTTNLTRYPFSMSKRIWMPATSPTVNVELTVTNNSNQPLPVHWGFHPAFGEAITGHPAELIGPFSEVTDRDEAFGTSHAELPGRLTAASAQDPMRIPLIPGEAATADLRYASCEAGWYAVRNESSGVTVGLTWPVSLFGKVWIWQECHDPSGYPWWGRHHIVGIEPHTSAPVQTLAQDITDGVSLQIGGGETVSATFSFHVKVLREEELSLFLSELATMSDSSKEQA